MKKNNLLKVLLFVLCLTIFLLIGIKTFFTGTTYSTYGAVTYFDKEGQFQLINSVGEDYVLYNAKEERFISGFILYYTQKNEKLYMITNPNKREIVYCILNTENESMECNQDITKFSNFEQTILSNTDDMVDLTKKRSQHLKNILKFFPQEYRKW